MKKNTVEKVYFALRDERPEITLPEDVRAGAERALRRMLELS
jgi:quinolinate synthase